MSGDSPLYTNRMKIRHAHFEQSQWYSVSPENVSMMEHAFIISLISFHFFLSCNNNFLPQSLMVSYIFLYNIY